MRSHLVARALTLFAVTTAALVVGASTARADGDPASDVLYTGRVFFPYSATISRSAQEALVEAVGAAEKAGYPIRAALIADPADLGSVTALWAKPRRYATFLGLELSFVYKGPLLIVMPSGLGFAHYKQGTKAEYATLAHVRAVEGHDGLAATAVAAVRALSARAGYPIESGRAGSASSSSASRVLAGAIALAVLVASGGGIIAVRRLRAARGEGEVER